MKKLNLILIGLCIVFAAHAQVHFKWAVESSRAAPTQFSCYRGETILLQPVITSYGEPVSNYTATVYWQTNGMDTAWWTTNALVFCPAMDVGASSYTLFVKADTTNGTSYRANAVIRMLSAPGVTPNSLPYPVQLLNFSNVSWTNAPWLLVESDPGIPAAIDTSVAVSGTNAQAAAAEAQANAIAFSSTNKTVRLFDPSNTSRFIDGSGNQYVISNFWTMTFSDGFADQYGGKPLQDSYVFTATEQTFTESLGGFPPQYWGMSWTSQYGFRVFRQITGIYWNDWRSTTNAYILDYAAPMGGGTGYAIITPSATTSLVSRLASVAYVQAIQEYHQDSYTNLIWKSVYSNGWMWLVAFTNYPAN